MEQKKSSSSHSNLQKEETIFQKFIWNKKSPQVATAIFKRKKQFGRITLPDIKI